MERFSPYGSTNPEWRAAIAAGRSFSQVSDGYLWERTRANSLQDFENVLEKESRRSQVAALVGVGTSRLATLRSGDQVTIQGLSGAEGEYGIFKITHTWNPAFGYLNEFHCTPWKKWTSPVRPQPPRFSGILPARVADNNDPDGCGRIKVQFYWPGQNEITEWMTLMAPNAGPGRGIMFVPEIGDEVWVAFEEGDPERGRILGSTWNGVQKAPWQEIRGGELPANNAKWIRTKTGNYLAFSDQPDRNEISIGTPNIRVRLIDKAQETNGESVLVFDSPGHIVFNAGGRIHFRSKTFSKEVGDDQVLPPPPPVPPSPPARYPLKLLPL